jgi:citrate synthase
MSSKAVLILGDKKVELPVMEGSEGERAVDISRLRDRGLPQRGHVR